jgi:glycerol-3-phosphate O-acyltransferase
METLPTQGKSEPTTQDKGIAGRNDHQVKPLEVGLWHTHGVSRIEGRYGFILKVVFRVLFSRVRFIPQHVERLRDLAERGTLVYVLRSRSTLESLLCHYQALQEGLPAPVYAYEKRLTLFFSLGSLMRDLLRKIRKAFGTKRQWQRKETAARGIEDKLRKGQSVILYLQDLESFERRFLKSGVDPFQEVMQAQLSSERPIFLVPMMIIWDRLQQASRFHLDEVMVEQRRPPSDSRVLFNFLRFFRRDSYISQAAPLNLKAYLSVHAGERLETLAIQLRRELLERLKTERRIVTGPIARSRQEIMERVLLDERVQHAIQRRAKRKGRPVEAIRKEAYRIIREIAADYRPWVLRFWDMLMEWALKNLYDGMEVDKDGLERVRQAARHSNLVLVPCHKSHMDYMILAYVFYHNYLFPPLIAAGLNLAFWPMGFLFRKSGAFFIRRSFRGSTLYPAIFSRYLTLLLEDGYPLEFFIEGGRSRSGKLTLPKLGFLSLIIEAYRKGACRDISFVPIAIAYERVMEESSFLREVEGGEKRKESFWGVIKSTDVIRRRYGKIHITFNEPISLRDFLQRTIDNPEASIQYNRQNTPYYLAYELAHRINQVMVVVPMSLAACAILCCSSVRGFTQREAVRVGKIIWRSLRESGARFSSTLDDEEKVPRCLVETLETLRRDKYIQKVHMGAQEMDEREEDVVYEIQDRARRRLDYYKNSILHYLLPYSFVALSVLAEGEGICSLDHVIEDAEFFRDLFRQEFVFLPGESLEGPIGRTLDHMVSASMLRAVDGGYVASKGKRKELMALGRLVQGYLESYYVVGSSLKYIAQRRLSQRVFLWRIRWTGHRMYHTGRVQLPEALSQVNYLNAIEYLVDKKIIMRQVDKTFREGVYYRLSLERRKIHWSKIKRFLRVLR